MKNLQTVKEAVAKHQRVVAPQANLRGANLGGANLGGANLRGANLRGAYLERANLERANLERANLEGANLRGAYLERANLRGANLRGAYLERAYLERANGLIAINCSHGWTLFLVRHPKGPKVLCGCHWFTVKEAESHWKKHPNKQRQKVVLPMLRAALAIAKAERWKV